jgi:hypothetical protein
MKKTIGKIATELAQKSHDNTHTAHDQMEESLSDWDKNIFECVERSKKDFSGDFYLVVVTKKERLLTNVIRNYFMTRISCPTPDYDQTLYKYNSADESLAFLWVIPSKDACLMLKENAMLVMPEERQLLQFVLDFADGSLFEMAKKLNGESENSILLQE